MEKDAKVKSKKNSEKKDIKKKDNKITEKKTSEKKETVKSEKIEATEKETVKPEKVEVVEKEEKVEKDNYKETKKKKNKISYSTGEQTEVRKFIIVILIVLLCVVGIYFLTRLFVTKDLFKDDDNKKEEVVVPGEVNYDVAIIGTIMNRPYDEYYVAIYDATGDYNYDMSVMVSSYKNQSKLHIYRVDLSSELNKSYYNPDEVNEKATGVSDLKVGDITLLRIKNGKITKYITELDAMKKELGVE